jgi:ABC-2 type transport system ATP-binding protein
MYHLIRWLIRNWRSRRAATQAQAQAQIQNQAPGAAPTTGESAAGEAATDKAAADEPSAPTRPARPPAGRVTGPPTLATAPGGKISGSPALSVDGLTKRFGDRVAFSDVSFEVGYGEVFGFLGPNGAGKTTTVRTLGTLFAPTSGSASVAGISLSPENGAEIRRRISIMPESPGLYLRLSVAENLEYFADLYDAPDPRDRIDRALRAVRLADRAQDPCGALSKGLRQRVALARALLSDPAVLFLDEPTAGLDPVAARDVHELIDDLRQHGVTIFLTTHRLEEAERLCDRVAILNRTLRTVGRPEELRERMFAKSLTVRTLAPLPEPDRVFGGLPAVDGWQQDGAEGYAIAVSDTQIAAPAVTRALVQAGADVLSVGESRHSLEDVYLELIDEDEEARSR